MRKKRDKRRDALKRVGVIALAVMMALDFIPVIGGVVVYADDNGVTYEEDVVYLSEAEAQAEKEKAMAAEEIAAADPGTILLDENGALIGAPETAGKAQAEAQAEPEPELTAAGEGDDSNNGVDETPLRPIVQDKTGRIKVTGPDSNGKVTVTGTSLATGAEEGEELEYEEIRVGDSMNDFSGASREAYLYGSGSFTKTIDMTDYSVGYHTIYVELSNGTILQADYVPTYVYQTACNDPLWYYTNTTYFEYCYDGTTYEDLDVFMDYRKVDDPNYSQQVYRMQETGQEYWYCKAGLEENQYYDVRMMYGRVFNYGGNQWVFTGRQNDYVSESVQIQTVTNSLNLKSVAINKGKVKKHKVKYWYATRYYYRVRNGHRKLIRKKKLYHTYRWNTTKFKVNVNLKKKQGLEALRIETIQGLGVWKLGDKTSYSQKFECRGKKKGKKVSVTVYGARTISGEYVSNFTNKITKKVKVK